MVIVDNVASTVHSSVAVGKAGDNVVKPTDANPLTAVPVFDDDGIYSLPIDKSANSLQLDPFQSSVTAYLPGEVGPPPKLMLMYLFHPQSLYFYPYLRLLTSVQEVPFQISVSAIFVFGDGGAP